MWTPADQLALDSCIARRSNIAYKTSPTYAAEVERAIDILTSLKDDALPIFTVVRVVDSLDVAAQALGWSDEDLEEVRDAMREELWTQEDERRLTALKLDQTSLAIAQESKAREIARLVERKGHAEFEKDKERLKDALRDMLGLGEDYHIPDEVVDKYATNASALRAALAPFSATASNR